MMSYLLSLMSSVRCIGSPSLRYRLRFACITSLGMYMPTFPLTVRVPRVRSSFVGHSIIPISYPRNRALPVWAWVISVFSAERGSCSSVARNVDILSLIWWASTKGPANPRRKSSAYLTYRNLLYPGSSGFWEGYRFISLHRALILSRFPCRRAVASASSRLRSGVADFGNCWETAGHKEVSHEQEVRGPAVGGRADGLPGDHQDSQGIVAEVSSCSDPAQGRCRWGRVAGCQDCRGLQLPRANDRASPQTPGHRKL